MVVLLPPVIAWIAAIEALRPSALSSMALLTASNVAFGCAMVRAPKPEPVDHWQLAFQAIDEAIIEARHNPETARSLFALASYGRRDPETLERLRATFTKESIPLEFLSHYVPDGPFACRSQNDVLSDKL